MAESNTHKRAKAKAAGKTGRTEAPISRHRRLDAATRAKAVEVETSGQPSRLEKAALRLKASGKTSRILVVPQVHMTRARSAMKTTRTSGTVRNLSGTKYSKVSLRKPSRNASSAKRTNSARQAGSHSRR